MSVSVIEGTIASLDAGRRSRKLRVYRDIAIRQTDGSARSLGKMVVEMPVAILLEPGVSGRFYLYKAIDHQGMHGIRTADGRKAFAYPKNNQMIAAGMAALMLLWIFVSTFAIGDGIPLLAVFFFVFGVALWLYSRSIHKAARAQFDADGAQVPLPAAV